jgi:hypothetical protein
MTTTLITDYLGRGLLSARPSSVAVAAGAAAFYYATDTGNLSLWNGSSWVNEAGGVYMVAGFSGPAHFTANQIIFGHQFAAAVSFPAGFGVTPQGPASTGGSFIAATGSTAINVDKCPAASDPTSALSWTTIGTMTVAPAGHSASFATTGGLAQAFAENDYMRWITPADATLASFFATLAGSRV